MPTRYPASVRHTINWVGSDRRIRRVGLSRARAWLLTGSLGGPDCQGERDAYVADCPI